MTPEIIIIINNFPVIYYSKLHQNYSYRKKENKIELNNNKCQEKPEYFGRRIGSTGSILYLSILGDMFICSTFTYIEKNCVSNLCFDFRITFNYSNQRWPKIWVWKDKRIHGWYYSEKIWISLPFNRKCTIKMQTVRFEFETRYHLC